MAAETRLSFESHQTVKEWQIDAKLERLRSELRSEIGDRIWKMWEELFRWFFIGYLVVMAYFIMALSIASRRLP